MTNISKTKTKSADFKAAEEILYTLIGSLNKSTADELFTCLLTESERIMVTKRFAAAFMYSSDYSPYRASQLLGVSISTAQRIYERYQCGTYDKLLARIQTKEQHALLSLINDLIAAQASPRARARIMKRVS